MLQTRPVESHETITPFRVWLRPMGQSFKVAVEAGHEAKWLAKQLAEHGFEVQDLVQDTVDLHCTLRCLMRDGEERKRFEKLVAQWPEVRLQLNPEYSSGSISATPSPHLSSKPMEVPETPTNIDAFSVWVRPMGNAWKIRADGRTGSDWLKRELEARGLTCSEPCAGTSPSMFVFRCMSETPHEASYVWNLLKALPQVLMQTSPA